MKVSSFVTGPFQENCYLVSDDRTGVAAIVDPGAEGDRLVAAVRDAGVHLEAVWLTHAHVDHLGAVAAVVRAFRVPVFLHPRDRMVYSRGSDIAVVFGIDFEQPPPPDREFAEGEGLSLGDLRFQVMCAPGHAPGHVVLHGEGVAFVGDCLFAGSIGRTDIPMSDGARLEQSLARIVALPESTVVYPGHGPPTTIGEELRSNPFLTGVARPLKR